MPIHDVLTVGRCGVDIYPLQTNCTLEKVETFGKFLGGSPMNVAVAAARLNEDCAILSGVGEDPFGRWVRMEMQRLGVSDEFVIVDPKLNTPVTFCEIIPPDHFPFFFYREPTAPDLQIRAVDVPHEQAEDALLVWVSGTGLSEDPSWTAHRDLLRLRNRKSFTVFDMDWRPMFWKDPQEASRRYAEVLEFSTIAVGNQEECAIAVGESDPDRAADALLERGVDLAIVKQGGNGTLAKTREERIQVPVMPCAVMNGAGAGDAFGGSLIHGLLQGWSVRKTIEWANAAGAVVASRLECSTAMPTEDELTAVMSAGTVDVLAEGTK